MSAAAGFAEAAAAEAGGPAYRRRLNVGVPDHLPKLIVHRLPAPVFAADDPPRVAAHGAGFTDLLAGPAVHRFDVLPSDRPPDPAVAVRTEVRELGGGGVTFFAAAPFARRLRGGSPGSPSEPRPAGCGTRR